MASLISTAESQTFLGARYTCHRVIIAQCIDMIYSSLVYSFADGSGANFPKAYWPLIRSVAH
jgi:hypothetical protein